MDRKPPLGATTAAVAILILLAGLWWQVGANQPEEKAAPFPEGAPAETSPLAGAPRAAAIDELHDARKADATPTNPSVDRGEPLAPAVAPDAMQGGSTDASLNAATNNAVQSPAESESDSSDPSEGVDMSIPAERERVVAKMRASEEAAKAAGIARAKELGLPARRELSDGRVQEVEGVDENGQLLYLTTENVDAAISTAANLVQAAPYNLTGANILVGVWDGGAVRPTHQEMAGRVTVRDGAANDDHATHVGGTIIASGLANNARGMATAARIDSYNSTSDRSELTSAGATTHAETNKVLVSNHSYGNTVGWDLANGVWEWWGNGTTAAGLEQDFGRYNELARSNDVVAASIPFTAIFWSAGNERTDNPTNGATIALTPGGATTLYNSSLHPPSDGAYRGGYETISHRKVAKNVIVIGAVADAVLGGMRATSVATNTSFSSFGPTDDGRVKPDVVANGDWLYSAGSSSDTHYSTKRGTSMASPNAAGSAVLVAQEYIRLFGQAMRSSTMRGLLIHTADDLGTAGPDYRNGWGMVNTKEAIDLVRDHAANADRARLSENLITSSSNTVTRSFVWNGLSPIRGTICWTDPPGTATSTSDLRTPRLVNDLNLRVIAPDGTTYFPYVMPFVGTWTQASMSLPATTSINNTDNVEQVYIAAPPAQGTYQAVVTYQGTLSGNQQHFSMLVSGSGGLPGVAPGVVATALNSTSIRVNWSPAPDATSYKILRDGAPIATIFSGTSYTDTCLAPATEYSYRVVSSNAAGDAAPSSLVVTRTDESPVTLAVLSPQSSAIATNVLFFFSGQAGAGLTNGITWSNAASGVTGLFASSRDWTVGIPLVPGTNVVTIRSPWSITQNSLLGWDYPELYATNSWSTGINSGSGFGPWTLSAPTANSGHFIASQASSTNVSVGGSAGFGLWAHTGGVATATRSFSMPMQVRSRFTMQFDNNLVAAGGGASVGFALTDTNNNRRFAFSYTGGQSNYRIHDASGSYDTGLTYTTSGLSLVFELSGSNTYKFTVGANDFTGTLAAGGSISRLVASNSTAGPFPQSGRDRGYDFFLGRMELQSVAEQSGIAEAIAPSVFLPPASNRTDGIPDAWWDGHQIPANQRSASADKDRDSLSNMLEYFAGLDPTLPDAGAAFARVPEAGMARMDYRRSKLAEGFKGMVSWKHDLGSAAEWSFQGVTDVLLHDGNDYEMRRATVSWPRGEKSIFMRLNVVPHRETSP